MKANEVRVGNLVAFGQEGSRKVIEVTPLDIDALNVFYINQKKHSPLYRGIPITEEWLLKFGFRQDRSVWELPLSKEINNLPSSVQMWNDSNEFQICRNGTYATAVKCDFVHQFQNLFFTLTGKELKVTSPTSSS